MTHECETHRSVRYPGRMIDHADIVGRFGHCGICSDECQACNDQEKEG
jgi:hypothetical protein